MIRNIIFDLGNVLISWKPEEFLRLNGWDDKARKEIMDNVFRSPEWLMLDNGDLTLEQAVAKIAERSSLKIPEILAVFDLRTSILVPIEHNTKLLPALKEHGFKLYYLSNFPGDIFDEIFNNNDLFRYFDGGLISARVNVSKPDPAIFRMLMEQYSLKPEESVFIDDIKINSDSAGSLGINAIHLGEDDQLCKVLEEKLGVVLCQ
jgi:putative hydrolase of the HAD superfamily